MTLALARPWRRAAVEPLVLRWLLVSRLVTLGCFLVLYAIGPMGHLGSELYHTPLAILGAWDGHWYRKVAEQGYVLIPGHQSDPAFFPLFPILMRGLHAVGLPFVLGGALIANVAFVIAVVAFERLGRRLLSEELAVRGAVFLALTPMGFVYSMSYPESLLLALSLLAALAALDGRWTLAAFLAALAALTRPEGLFLTSVPFAAIAWRGRRMLDAAARGRALAAVLAAPAALGAFLLYLQWALGDALAWSKAEEPWGRSFRLTGLVSAVIHLPRLIGSQPLLIRDALLLVLYAALIVTAARRTSLRREWIVSGALILVLPLFSGTVESEGRFGLLALPMYWGLAALTGRPALERGARLGSLALLVAGVMTVPFIWP